MGHLPGSKTLVNQVIQKKAQAGTPLCHPSKFFFALSKFPGFDCVQKFCVSLCCSDKQNPQSQEWFCQSPSVSSNTKNEKVMEIFFCFPNQDLNLFHTQICQVHVFLF